MPHNGTSAIHEATNSPSTPPTDSQPRADQPQQLELTAAPTFLAQLARTRGAVRTDTERGNAGGGTGGAAGIDASLVFHRSSQPSSLEPFNMVLFFLLISKPTPIRCSFEPVTPSTSNVQEGGGSDENVDNDDVPPPLIDRDPIECRAYGQESFGRRNN